MIWNGPLLKVCEIRARLNQNKPYQAYYKAICLWLADTFISTTELTIFLYHHHHHVLTVLRKVSVPGAEIKEEDYWNFRPIENNNYWLLNELFDTLCVCLARTYRADWKKRSSKIFCTQNIKINHHHPNLLLL